VVPATTPVPIPELEEHDSEPLKEDHHPNPVVVLTQTEEPVLGIECLMKT
jgi:hypothetical protein